MLAGLAACGSKSAQQGNGSEANQDPIIKNNISDTENMMTIDTPVGTLYYPEKWKDDVAFQVSETQVDASYYDTPLFSLFFGGDQGDVYGTVKQNDEEITIRYMLYDLDVDDEDFETMTAMQEDINVIFYYLMQDK